MVRVGCPYCDPENTTKDREVRRMIRAAIEAGIVDIDLFDVDGPGRERYKRAYNLFARFYDNFTENPNGKFPAS